ncbi:MAG: PEGA domain-containing protein [Lachnospiraceae bacterium]|nr:PEGA domain-containing protein [Lachnospiraceae bacterium]
MSRIHRRISGAVTVLTLAALVLTGCTSEASNIGRAKDKNGRPDVVDTGFTLSTVGSYDSADTAVVLSTDLDNKAVSLINMDTGKQYTLYYDGTTYVKDKYDGPMTISQIKAGDVVDVTFLKGKKKLASIQRSPEAWVFDEVCNYDLAGANRTASIGSQTYSLPDGAVVLSEGRRVEAGEVVSQDVVTISGINHKIYSVNVDKGHGYLRLKNDQPLLGGWIEVGNSVIRPITEDMLLTVPEGSYQVVLTNKNVGCVKEITVERDKEVVLDVSDLEIAEDAVGKILFTVEPESAKVSVDGKPVDISKAVELKYGIHQIQAEANGYDTLTKHIQVGSEYATISFKLEESRKNDSENSVSGNTTTSDRTPWADTLETSRENKPSVSDNTTSSVSGNALGSSNNNKVYVDSPKGVEVYLDGNYVGIAPVRFTKTAGRHEITLKKSGYKTKTYTIYLENNKQDETYSFSALEKESSGNNNNSDGNNSNGGTVGDTDPPPLTGKVSFTVSPEDAKVSVDGKEVDISEPLELDFGVHKIIVSADGYETLTEEIELEAESAEYSFTLRESQEPDQPEPGNPDDKDPANPPGEDTETPVNPAPENPDKPTNPTNPDEGQDNTGSGDQNGDDQTGTDGSGTESGGSTETGGTQDGLTTEKVEITKEAHPIRKWFSSLFK